MRYLHDETGRIWFGPAPKLIAKDQLTRRKRLLATAALTVTPVLFQACGGADPYQHVAPSYHTDAGADDPEAEQQGVTPSEPEPTDAAEDVDPADAGVAETVPDVAPADAEQ